MEYDALLVCVQCRWWDLGRVRGDMVKTMWRCEMVSSDEVEPCEPIGILLPECRNEWCSMMLHDARRFIGAEEFSLVLEPLVWLAERTYGSRVSFPSLAGRPTSDDEHGGRGGQGDEEELVDLLVVARYTDAERFWAEYKSLKRQDIEGRSEAAQSEPGDAIAACMEKKLLIDNKRQRREPGCA